MYNEGTIYNGENSSLAPQDKKQDNRRQLLGNAGIGMAAGIGLGAVAPHIASAAEQYMTSGETTETADTEHPAWTDGQVAVATSVDDSMTFAEAFSAARAEVGSGGVFEWRGNIYNTYTKTEWDSRSASERAEYGSHMHCGSHDIATNHHTGNTHGHGASHTNDTAHHDEGSHDTQQGSMAQKGYADDSADEVEVLGVVHDDNTGYTYAGVNIDGQDVVLIDVDNDHNADYAAVDADGDGEIGTGEVASLDGLDVPMPGAMDGGDYMQGGYETPMDYTTDASYV